MIMKWCDVCTEPQLDIKHDIKDMCQSSHFWLQVAHKKKSEK